MILTSKLCSINRGRRFAAASATNRRTVLQSAVVLSRVSSENMAHPTGAPAIMAAPIALVGTGMYAKTAYVPLLKCAPHLAPVHEVHLADTKISPVVPTGPVTLHNALLPAYFPTVGSSSAVCALYGSRFPNGTSLPGCNSAPPHVALWMEALNPQPQF